MCGVAPAFPLENDAKRVAFWQEQGFSAEMKYMQRDPRLLSDARHLSQNAKSVLSVAVFYQRTKSPESRIGYGRVARYAWGRDYHTVLKSKLEQFGVLLAKESGCSFRAVTDAAPILERAWARKSGLGFIGKNTLLITPGPGSFSLLGELILDCEVLDIPTKPPAQTHCGGCRRCLDACPTNAIVEEFTIDAAKCISYLTIEKRGHFENSQSAAIGEWVFGCDICQDICPYNTSALKHQHGSSIAELSAAYGVGGLLNLADIMAIKTNKEFEVRFKYTPLLRARRSGLIRNACAVAVNTRCFDLIPQIKLLAANDRSLVIRQAAQQALSVLAGS